VTLQDLILKLSQFWASQGCLIQQPLDLEVGAGTSHPETLLRVLGPTPWNVGYVQPTRRPDDGRFGQNPNRLFKHHQFQVILKPAPDEVLQTYLESLEAVGINPRHHDIRFEEDNWESPTLGAWGIGWQVMLDGMEITQFTYFQQVGGIDLSPISAEITYGIERIAMFLQKKDSMFDLEWGGGKTYGDVRMREEVEQSKYAFNQDTGIDPERFAAFHRNQFDENFKFGQDLLKGGLLLPALEYCLKCSHLFNLLDSSGSVGVTERTAYILRVRQLAIAICKEYAAQQEPGAPTAGARSPEPGARPSTGSGPPETPARGGT
jgi:glycyl-tRNA synthetase alpha chain